MSVDKIEGILLSQGEVLSKTTKITFQVTSPQTAGTQIQFVASELSCLVKAKLIKME
jgi:hypothetical protein